MLVLENFFVYFFFKATSKTNIKSNVTLNDAKIEESDVNSDIVKHQKRKSRNDLFEMEKITSSVDNYSKQLRDNDFKEHSVLVLEV